MSRQSVKFRRAGSGDSLVIDFANLAFPGRKMLVLFIGQLEEVLGHPNFPENLGVFLPRPVTPQSFLLPATSPSTASSPC